MNAYKSIEHFASLIQCNKRGREFKLKVAKEFCDFLVDKEGLEGDWNFGSAKKIVFQNKIYRIPIDSGSLRDFLSECISLSPSMYNEYVIALRQLGHYLYKQRILTEDPAEGLEKRKVDKKNDMTNNRLTYEEGLDLLWAAYRYDEVHRNRNFSLVLLLLTTANRPKEFLTLTVDKTFFDHQIMYVEGKTVHNIRYMTPGLKETLQVLINDPCRKEALKNEPVDYLFYSVRGGMLELKELNCLLKTLAKQAGIERDITSYWLRRTFATMLGESGFNAVEIQTVFDHKLGKTQGGYLLNTIKKDLRKLVEESTVNNMLTNLVRGKMGLV